MSSSVYPSFGKYDASGRITIRERAGEVVIRSRYHRGAALHVGLAVAVLLSTLGHVWWRWLIRGLTGWGGHLVVGGAMAIGLALWGCAYFYRRDELVLSSGACSYTSWVPFQPVVSRNFQRGEMIRLSIGESNYVYRLQVDLGGQGLGIYSHAHLSRVREAAERLRSLLGLPLEGSSQPVEARPPQA